MVRVSEPTVKLRLTAAVVVLSCSTTGRSAARSMPSWAPSSGDRVRAAVSSPARPAATPARGAVTSRAPDTSTVTKLRLPSPRASRASSTSTTMSPAALRLNPKLPVRRWPAISSAIPRPETARPGLTTMSSAVDGVSRPTV